MARRKRPGRRLGPSSPAALIEALDAVKHRFTRRDRTAKLSILDALAGLPVADGALLLRFHDALCFLRAYPDDALLARRVEDALAGLPGRVAAVMAAGPAAAGRALEETGIAGTTLYCPLSLAAARWLVDRFPRQVEIDWDDAESEETLGLLLPSLSPPVLEDALVEAGVPARAWLEAATDADDRSSDLAFILDRLGQAPDDGERVAAFYDARQFRLRWELGESWASRTRAKARVPRIFYHRGALPRWRGRLTRRLPGSRVAVRRAQRGEADELLDLARAAVVVRYREIYAFNFADLDDVLVADVGRGARIAWFGLDAARRLPLRAHYGYLLLKNGVPVGYGDASLLFEWVEIAYNVFETFRRGESAFLFVRVLAFLYERFGVRAFHLSPYQLGRGNDEALQSGAFWFYAKLGFRPKPADRERLAAAERRRVAREPGYRSSPEMLAQLGEGGMFLAVGGRDTAVSRDFEARRVGFRAARHLAGHPSGEVTDAVAGGLGARGWRAWPRAERQAFERLAPFIGAIPDLASWPVADRAALVAVIRAKGGPREADYLRRLRAHHRLRAAVLQLGKPAPGA